VFSKESLYQAIQNGEVAEHPAWEDYIVWKNREAHIFLMQKSGFFLLRFDQLSGIIQ